MKEKERKIRDIHLAAVLSPLYSRYQKGNVRVHRVTYVEKAFGKTFPLEFQAHQNKVSINWSLLILMFENSRLSLALQFLINQQTKWRKAFLASRVLSNTAYHYAQRGLGNLLVCNLCQPTSFCQSFAQNYAFCIPDISKQFLCHFFTIMVFFSSACHA